MQILYLVAILAFSFVCAGLVITTRRILRSNPLQSGELRLAHFNPADLVDPRLESDRQENKSTFPRHNHWLETEVESEPLSIAAAAEEPVASSSSGYFVQEENDTRSSENVLRGTVEVGPVLNQAQEPAPKVIMACSSDKVQDEAESTAIQPKARKRKFSMPPYTYVLEAMLIGVSMVVLVRTQKNTTRFRLKQASRARVA